jgi:hypothetical protein
MADSALQGLTLGIGERPAMRAPWDRDRRQHSRRQGGTQPVPSTKVSPHRMFSR